MAPGNAVIYFLNAGIAIPAVCAFLYLGDTRISDRCDRWFWSMIDGIGGVALRLRQRIQCRHFARIAGRCLKCGYDLIHNVSGVCPECGTPIHENRCPPS
ncbi:MAG: hypothetical protein JWO87_2784 [Phycisphaerales bacterium]|jgi:uncharacterized paraquat-inducible protein A|nr:hypothetical protein [Phycisphaerales bacterium]